jgi:uroporphyrinogen decarboxylase
MSLPISHLNQPEARSQPDESWLISPDIPEALNRRQRFLRAAHCRAVSYPPVWLMRQAGRCLPEYRKLKETYSFLDLVHSPELAAEVTLQPIRRFDFDAAIIFSDILVIPQALGQGFRFSDAGGISMDFLLNSAEDIQRLNVESVPERLAYVAEAIRLTKKALDGNNALLGFSGSPWTLASFMIEGGSATTHSKALELFESNPDVFSLLMVKLTRAVTEFLEMQIDAGADAVQIFDSLGGLLPARHFEAASGTWIRRIISGLNGRVPVIVFSKGTHCNWDTLTTCGAQVLGVDHAAAMAEVKSLVPPTIALQGNLNPELLNHATPEKVAAETAALLAVMRGRDGHIFNLGHGVPPDAKLENIQSLLETVRNSA